MSADTVLELNIEPHLRAWSRMAATSKKTLPALWKEEARICFGGSGSMPGVAGITPPYGEGGLQNARTAQSHARAKVAADIMSVYGTPGEAYDLLKDVSPGEADPFWWLYKHGDTAGASDLLRGATGSILHAFDDGAHHRKNFRRRAKRFRFFVSDPQNLKAYVQLEQEQIWWLASGWAEPLEALGAKLPAGVKKHSSPGHLEFRVTDADIVITISNDVSYAGQIKDMKRRIQTVMNEWRVARLDRMWENYQETLAKAGGLTLK
jgi:hypothetical protein